MEDPKKEILTVSVSPIGQAHLRTLAKTTKWSYIFSIVVSSVYFLQSIGRMADAVREKYSNSLALRIEGNYLPWLYLLMTVLTPIEFYLYYRFVRHAKKAVDVADAEQFNQSFQYIVRGNYLALFMMALSVLEVALELWLRVPM